METVKVSSKYQVVIPEKVRKDAGISPGDRMMVIVKHGILQYVPIRALNDTRGVIPGLETEGIRDESDRS